METGMTPALIALDWGTSSLRAYLMDGNGRVIDRRSNAHGIQNLPVPGIAGFERVFAEICAELASQSSRLARRRRRHGRQRPGLGGGSLCPLPGGHRHAGEPRRHCGNRFGRSPADSARRDLRPARCQPRRDARRGNPDRRRAGGPPRFGRTRLRGAAGHPFQMGPGERRADRPLRHLYDRRVVRRPVPAFDPRPADAGG